MAENLQKTITNTSNRLWRNVGAYPLVAFSFMLRVEGMWDLPCKQIHNMSRENEFDYIQEGGLNDYVHAKRKPISKPFTFQVDRYVGVDLAVASDPLALGTELVLPLLLFVNKYAVWDVKEMKSARTYAFTGCTVIGKNYGTLDAEKSGLLVETTTIAYREMACIDVYSELDGMTLDAWEFDGYKKKGSGPRRYNQATSNTEELTKREMAEKAQLWEISKEGSSRQNSNERKIPQNKVSKRQLERKAKLYPKTSSVEKPENKVPKARLYPKKSSVKKPENKIPEAELWSIGGGENKPPDPPKRSNQREIGKNKEKKADLAKKANLYPEKQSVEKPKNEIPEARLYPEKPSVKKPENQVPQARLWPKKKSAQTITQYLNDYKK